MLSISASVPACLHQLRIKSKAASNGSLASKFASPCGRELSGGLWTTKMRILEIVALSAALSGCGWPRREMTTRPGDQVAGQNFIGQNVTSLVTQFGNPVSRNKTDNNQTSYAWELEAATDLGDDRRFHTGYGGLYGDGHTPGYMSDDRRRCKISVTVSPEGIITQVVTEDQNGTGASSTTLGFNGSICAKRLGMKPET
jgi:hypothetical protein